MTLGGISSGADTPSGTVAQQTGWLANLGLGRDFSSYVRGEIDFQARQMAFKHDGKAATHDLGAMVYFDFIRRYERYGDITERRIFVPFMGIGVAGGDYNFTGGDNGAFIAPRASLGFNIALNNLWGLDFRYQYSMMISNHFGWESSAGARHLQDFIVSLRAGF